MGAFIIVIMYITNLDYSTNVPRRSFMELMWCIFSILTPLQREKHPWRSVNFGKALAMSKLTLFLVFLFWMKTQALIREIHYSYFSGYKLICFDRGWLALFNTVAYLELLRASEMEVFVKIVKGLKPLTIFEKSSVSVFVVFWIRLCFI